MPRVAIIGCGAAGIVAIRQLSDPVLNNEIVAYERNDDIGGIWYYRNKTTVPPGSFPCPMYSNLHTNLPYEVMPFLDEPIPPPDDDRHFITHQEVLSYLKNYAKDHNCYQYIRFRHSVHLVEYVEEELERHWRLTVKNLDTNSPVSMEYFDYVVVANGHFEVPAMPLLPNIHLFEGQVLHSTFYDHPEDFTDKQVVVLGAAASGQDISLDLQPYAKQVYLSHRRTKPLSFTLPSNVCEMPVVTEFKSPNIVCFQDGTSVCADVFIYCTGYRYSFPFLHPSCGIEINEDYVEPLYLHCVNILHPSMLFVGLCQLVCPFPLFYLQVKSFIRIMQDGALNMLPSTEKMLKIVEDAKQKCRSKNIPIKKIVVLDDAQWEYCRKLAELANCEPIPQKTQSLYQEVKKLRMTDFHRFRSAKIYEIDGDYQLTLPTSH